MNPRPLSRYFEIYYTESESSKYWATTFYKQTEKSRREKIWIPKAKMVFDILSEHKLLDHQIIEIGGGYGTFAEEMSKYMRKSICIIEPSTSFSKGMQEKRIQGYRKIFRKVRFK